ncbi:DUF2953 domain-containing protein [Clostridium perfringens]|uniref:DUF2953 domain-containing protein n=1 Tax=Clostridium perfringens TaxID=1502 RepID=UPI0023310767|nr:DUF2953 domain-containing protein [Clostridium perfringens]MDB2054357.1 DUF2953 domain-containing protein [Clostridium perfringens]MDM0677305.1 DUF2953 domain-containing protein [Clostridium perfringens]MDM0679999.1 DUF2953 domain-containing protein [Clostridium perfringens]MDM0682899.1 DUF2953 domain-containing protein [Clostridium perfringens]
MLKFFLLFLLLLLLVLLFFPINLKFKLVFSEKDFKINFYKFEILSLNKILGAHKEKKEISKKGNKDTKIKNSSKKKRTFLKPPSNLTIAKLIKLLTKSKFKPSLKIVLDLNFSSEDAALTAILYGFIHQILSLIYTRLDYFFKLKKFTGNINPKFNNENYLFFEVQGIITINFAQIIYIGFLYLLNFKKL